MNLPTDEVNLRKKRGEFYIVCGNHLTNDIDWQSSHHLPHVSYNAWAGEFTAHQISPLSTLYTIAVEALQPYHPSILEWDVHVVHPSHPTTARWGQFYRSVAYWLRQPRCDLPILPTYLYHGTSSELYYSGIQSEGLKPRKEGHLGYIGSYGASGALSIEDRIYLSAHPDAATRTAAFQAAQKHGGFPTIIQIKSEFLNYRLLTPDEDSSWEDIKEHAWEDFGCEAPPSYILSMQQMGACAYVGKIPAEAIRPFVRCTSTAQSDKDYRWIGWDSPPRTIHPLTRQLIGAQSGGFLSLDLPVKLALLEAELVKKVERRDSWGSRYIDYQPTDVISDQQVKQALLDNPWVHLAAKLIEAFNAWGSSNIITRLNYYPINQVDPQVKLLFDLLLKYRIYYGRHGYLERGWSLGIDEDRLINLAKHLHFYRFSLPEINATLSRATPP